MIVLNNTIKMLIITLNLDSVLLLLHNSKLAYYGFPLYANEVNGRFPFVQCFFLRHKLIISLPPHSMYRIQSTKLTRCFLSFSTCFLFINPRTYISVNSYKSRGVEISFELHLNINCGAIESPSPPPTSQTYLDCSSVRLENQVHFTDSIGA